MPADGAVGRGGPVPLRGFWLPGLLLWLRLGEPGRDPKASSWSDEGDAAGAGLSTTGRTGLGEATGEATGDGDATGDGGSSTSTLGGGCSSSRGAGSSVMSTSWSHKDPETPLSKSSCSMYWTILKELVWCGRAQKGTER